MDKHLLLKHLKTILEPILHLISKCVKSVNGVYPDKYGNVELEIGSGLPSGGEPHQMFVTDADGKAVWEERTHYRVSGKEPLIDGQYETIELDGSYWNNNVPFAELIAGNHYLVIFDDVEYSCIAYIDQYEDICVGNITIPGDEGENTGEPFFYYAYNVNHTKSQGLATTEAGTHTLRIFDKKWHTADLTIQSDFSEEDETSLVYIKNKTHGWKTMAETLLDNVSVTYESWSMGSWFGIVDDFSYSFIIGDTYRFKYNGRTYDYVATETDRIIFEGVEYPNGKTGNVFIYGSTSMTSNIYFMETNSADDLSDVVISLHRVYKEAEQLNEAFIPTMSRILLASSTADSEKIFAITVDDSGTLTATEVTF